MCQPGLRVAGLPWTPACEQSERAYMDPARHADNPGCSQHGACSACRTP